MNVSFEPALPTLGMPLLLLLAGALAALTVWTYLGVQKATWRRVAIVTTLRLLALATALLMILRPSFATTQLEGIEISKLFVMFDNSASMNVADVEGKPTRWDSVTKLWESRDVQRRLEELRAVQKIEVVKYVAAEDLRPDEAGAAPTGRRTDIGAWLDQLFTRHGHERHLRGIIVFSDGGDNGSRFSAHEKAGVWKGIAPIYAFGAGDPKNEKFKKHIGLTNIDVRPKPITVKSKMEVEAIAQAPGYEKAKVDVSVRIEEENAGKLVLVKEEKIAGFEIKQEKDQPIRVKCEAPDLPGDYKVTLKVEADEATHASISTYVQVIKPKINVLWVDRFRVWEPRFAIDALSQEERFAVHYIEPPAEPKRDPVELYELDKRHYDVIIIGDVSAPRFCQGKPAFFERIREMVTKKKTGLLMLGGEDTFAAGDWQKQPAIMELLPVKFDAPPKFSTAEARALPTPGAPRFLQLHALPKKNDDLWRNQFDPLDGLASMGSLAADSTVLLGVDGDKKRPIMVATQTTVGGRVVVFATDATSRSWYDSPEAIEGHHVFWKQLVGWLARQEDHSNELWIKLDKRRLAMDAGDVLGFTFGLRGKAGEIAGAKFEANVVAPSEQKLPIRFAREGQHQRGTFQGAKEPGEYKIVIKGIGKDGDKDIESSGVARFLVADDNIELLRPAADHELLQKIAAASDGRFQLAQEANLLTLLDELQSQASRDARQKTTHWPDWQRVPASDHLRDQVAGMWNSFALVGFLLFVGIIGSEWLLRRLWGLV
ncbi:MAG TPA: vWA domain-containing protein [Gemmataceae bacterium]|nr:vWA domain-containing protein [Gemmataceae bacterium]